MTFGEGLILLAATAIATVGGYAFLLVIVSAARARAEQIAHQAGGGGIEAEALVPELAAAQRAPGYRGRCRCRSCRRRPQEPCSDYDGV